MRSAPNARFLPFDTGPRSSGSLFSLISEVCRSRRVRGCSRERPFVTESASNNTRRGRHRHYFLPFDRRACTPRVFRSRHGRRYRRANDTLDRRQESPYSCVYSPPIDSSRLRISCRKNLNLYRRRTRNAPIARDNFPRFARVTREVFFPPMAFERRMFTPPQRCISYRRF